MDKRKAFYLVYIGVAIFCAFSSGWISVNDNLTSYLPDTTKTWQGLTIMDKEFVTFRANRVMVNNITYQWAKELAATLETLEVIKSVGFDATEDHYRSGAALFDLTYNGTADDQISLDAEMQVVMVLAVVVALSKTIAEIALACGFRDSNYFGDAIKREKGVSPSAYRKNNNDTSHLTMQDETPRRD